MSSNFLEDPEAEEAAPEGDSPDASEAKSEVSAAPEEGESLTCVECGVSFTFAGEERRDYQKRGFHPPKRCPACRQQRRQKLAGRPRQGGRRGRQRGRDVPGKAPVRVAHEARGREAPQRSERVDYGEPSWENGAPGSYVQQAEALKAERRQPHEGEDMDGYGEESDPSQTESADSMRSRDLPRPAAKDREVDEENYGNSIYYQGPGVNPRVTARDENPQYAPWEGAHGMLLTHHEHRAKKKGPQGQQGTPAAKGRQKFKVMPGRGDFNGKKGGKRGNSNRNRKNVHAIVCHACGKSTEVPFKPLPDRPVYCRECYGQVRLKDKKSVELQEAPPTVSEEAVSDPRDENSES